MVDLSLLLELALASAFFEGVGENQEQTSLIVAALVSSNYAA